MDDLEFIKIPRGILEHLENGWISGIEFTLYVYLLLKADSEINIVPNISGYEISFALGISKSAVNNALRKLEKGSNFPGSVQYLKRVKSRKNNVKDSYILNTKLFSRGF